MTNSGEPAPGLEQQLAPLVPLTELCATGMCPTVYSSASGTLVVQGYEVSAERAGVDLPPGECLVEIPAELLAEALRTLDGRAA